MLGVAAAHEVGRSRSGRGSSPHKPAMACSTTGGSMNHQRHARLGMTLMVPRGPLWRWRAVGLAAQEKRGESHWGP
jgi:hypothetical protein